MDSTPGTTADTKVVLMELHDVGPAKLFDTGQWSTLVCDSQGACWLCVCRTAGGRWDLLAGWEARVRSAAVVPASSCLHPIPPQLPAAPARVPFPPTAGIDEEGLLGEKKRRKVLSVLKETDVAVVVLDAARLARWGAVRVGGA